jgi:hypothetical protein
MFDVRLDAATGHALLTGMIKCTRDDVIDLALELHQDQSRRVHRARRHHPPDAVRRVTNTPVFNRDPRLTRYVAYRRCP